MKRLSFILCIITFSFFISSCRTVSVTSANELTSSSWFVKNPNSLCATLGFDTKASEANLIITDEKGNIYSIDGVYAIDSENLYITSDTLYKTYTFGYKVYKDHLVLTYNGFELTFKSEKEKEP